MKRVNFLHGITRLTSIILIIIILSSFSMYILFFNNTGYYRGILHVEINPKLPNILDIFNLTKNDFSPPYPVINKSIFNHTLVTFLLPDKEFKSKYASIVTKDNKVYLYYWNDTNDYILYEEKEKLTKTWSNITEKKEDNYILKGNLTLGYYEFKLHPNKKNTININLLPTSSESDATTLVIYASYTIERYQNYGILGLIKIFHATASGRFYFIYGQYITNFEDYGSGAWADTFAVNLCKEDTIMWPSYSPSYSAQIKERAGFALLDCPVTTAYYVWPWVDVDLYGNVGTPSSPDDCATSWIAPACGCTGISWPF